ncbi:SDA1-domain-containing protein [Radiomyces spectabilis]|uniref:SDA1-domain-containing protein n=1 Tax=Radiomyces spectabilis TaxID=64574 RepID=UPI00221FBA2F|nr:SDA1-domain-containing protein [Radiomyces spectabilis]KAI8381544.1 SDA1-domain-containing protein [Radiomyces spectabilis]
MGKRNRAALLPTHLPQLQNLIKRDPKSYEAEFLQQYRHFQSMLSIFCLKPDEESKELAELVTFMSQVCSCYPKETENFPQQLVDLLKEYCTVLHPEVRRSLVQALILLRNKNVLDNTRLLPLFFTLFKCRDKQLRELLYNHIVNDIKNSNAKAKNNKLNKTLQSYMFTMLESCKTGNSEENKIAAKKSVDVCIDLYHKNIWNDAKTVNVIAEACFSPVPKIAVTAIKFFLNHNEQEEEEDEDDDIPDLKKMQQANLHNKKTKSKARKMEAAMKKVKRKSKSKGKAESFNFSALHLLNDPQGFAEKLYSKLASKEDRWEIRVMKMNLVSRVIGVHQLTLFGFYPLLIKYLQPSQRDVTMVLVAAAQASHALVPPDVLEPVLKAIANQFITDRVSNEVMAVGLNGIREICVRQPLAMDATLLQDLAQYKNHRDKGVMIGARSLIALFREINPELLARKDRGKSASMRMKDGSIKSFQFGEAGTMGIDGLQDIELLEEEGQEAEAGEDDGWEGWEVDESSDSDSDDGWIDVPDDDTGKYLDIPMSDDEKEENKTEDGEQKPKTRRIGKRQLRKMQQADEREELTEEEKLKLKAEAEARRAEEAKKQEAALKLATSRILTPADFAKLNELKMNKEAEAVAGIKRTADEKEQDGQVDEGTILGPRKKTKQDYEARMASIQEGREGREKFGSRKGKKERGSTTNREKSRNKNFMMIAHKRSVVSKSKRSLFDKQKQLRAAITKQKKMKH